MSNAKPREQIAVSISPDSAVCDQLLFENTDAGQLFYLPRYRIAEVVVSGKKRLRVQLKDDEADRGLTIYLEKYPAPELGDRTRTAQELQHKVRLMLRFGGQHELVFQEVTFSDNVLRGELRIERSSQLAELVNALTDSGYQTALVIQRTLTVAIPYDASVEIAELQSNLQGLLTRLDQIDSWFAEIRSTFTSLGMLWPNSREQWIHLIVTRQDGGFGRQALQFLDEKTEKDQKVSDIKQRLAFLSSTPLFLETDVSLTEEVAPNPFVFRKDVYEYIFRDVGDTTGKGDGLIQYQVVWNGISYSYYQEEERPTVFRYLPHAFKLASLPDAPDIPHLSVQFVWKENTTQPSGVQLTYRAVPFMDAARRATEAEQLHQKIHHEPNFEPLTSPSQLRIAIPSGWSSDSQPHIKEPIDLRKGFEDTVTLTWEGFREVYNSLFDRTSLLKGEVVAQVNLQQEELIPFVARVDDFVGSVTSVPDPNALLQRFMGRRALER